MTKTQWPTTVKTAWFDQTPSSVREAYRIPMGIGYQQVAVLLAVQVEVANSSQTNNTFGAVWLMRNGDPGELESKTTQWFESGGLWQQDTNVVDHTRGYVPARTGDTAYKVYPYPIILIRDPTVLVWTGEVDELSFTLGLWYVLQTVTDKEMSELMVKDHA